ncbi:hypothetical protein [Caulobacter phage Cr30]|uniref:hypothetical protein n=1 Tax=Caulobacter phage Cr30 TaxID=1357714 RepID=UPI0004A9B6B1|nr:hypothetical protein OZ74_gp017 [Caulobacter phage Cr30]AGS80902.1 hypothetical protein [Caulobacter phage Cr30]
MILRIKVFIHNVTQAFEFFKALELFPEWTIFERLEYAIKVMQANLDEANKIRNNG